MAYLPQEQDTKTVEVENDPFFSTLGQTPETRDLLEHLRWAQYCARYVTWNSHRFLRAIEQLDDSISFALTQQLGSFSQDDRIRAYDCLNNNAGKLPLTLRQASEIQSLMLAYGTLSRESTLSSKLSNEKDKTLSDYLEKDLEIGNPGILCARLSSSCQNFLHFSSTLPQNTKPSDFKVGPDVDTQKKQLANAVVFLRDRQRTQTSFYIEWRENSYRAWRLRAWDTLKLDQKILAFSRIEQDDSKPFEDKLEALLLIKQATHAWIQRYRHEASETSRLPAARDLLKTTRKKIKELCDNKLKSLSDAQLGDPDTIFALKSLVETLDEDLDSENDHESKRVIAELKKATLSTLQKPTNPTPQRRYTPNNVTPAVSIAGMLVFLAMLRHLAPTFFVNHLATVATSSLGLGGTLTASLSHFGVFRPKLTAPQPEISEQSARSIRTGFYSKD